MAIDPSSFHPINVADTCSVWNILSSSQLHSAAREAKCDFCVTSFVQYECLFKPRKSVSPSEKQLMDRLKADQKRGSFQAHSCGIDDLQTVQLLERRKRLGKGELSSIAFAMKIGQAFITDDRKAWQLARDSGHNLAQTTPHLLSWLVFTGRLGSTDKDVVITQHQEAGRHLAPHFQNAYELALLCKLRSANKS